MTPVIFSMSRAYSIMITFNKNCISYILSFVSELWSLSFIIPHFSININSKLFTPAVLWLPRIQIPSLSDFVCNFAPHLWGSDSWSGLWLVITAQWRLLIGWVMGKSGHHNNLLDAINFLTLSLIVVNKQCQNKIRSQAFLIILFGEHLCIGLQTENVLYFHD